MASKIVKTIKDKLTPEVVHTVHRHHAVLQMMGIAAIFLTLGFTLALFALYNKILTLEAAIAVLAG